MEMLSLDQQSPMKRKRFEEGDYSEKETPKRIKWQLVKKSTASPPKQSFVVQQQLGDLLQAVEKDELIRIITSLTANDSSLEDRVASLLPRPTLKLTLQILQNLETKLLDAIPYSKLGPDRSDYSFNRTRPQMTELHGSLLQYLDFFTLPLSYPSSLSHEYPSEAFGYLNETTKLVHRLPIWESEEKSRECKVPLYERLGIHWRICVCEVGKRVNDGNAWH
jgi:Cut8, nuclear proteasome tether protein